MLRNGIWLVAVFLLIFGPTTDLGFGEDSPKTTNKINKAIRKYQRFVKDDQREKAQRLAHKVAKKYPDNPAAHLLKQHSQLLAQSSQPRTLPQPVAVSKIRPRSPEKDQIVAQLVIVEVPDHFFEHLGLDLDFDFASENAPENKGTKPLGIDAEVLPQPNPSKPPVIKLTSGEEQRPFSIMSPLEHQLIFRAMRKGQCRVLSRPQICTLPEQPAEVQISENGGDMLGIKLVGTVSDNRDELCLKIEGQSKGQSSKCQTHVPLGKTLLMDLGSYTVQAASEQKVPILGDIPYTSRLFRNVGVARETRHRLAFITPRLVIEEETTNSINRKPN